jgi:surface antigen
MAYSSYGNQISGKLTGLNNFVTEVGKIDFSSIWSGQAYSKQYSNLTSSVSSLQGQITQLNDMVSVLSDIDQYDQYVKDLDLYRSQINALDTNASNYATEYQRLSNLIDDITDKKDKLKIRINNILNNTTKEYTRRYSEISSTEVVSTVDLLNSTSDYFSKIESGFDINSTVVPFGNGIIKDSNSNPDFSNTDAWVNKNPYAGRNTGQCTWFAWGRFYEIYGYSPGFTTNGNGCVNQLLTAHGDKFVKSNTPVAGAVFSTGLGEEYGHVGIVVEVDEENNRIVIQDGNQNGKSDSFAVAQKDWRTKEYSLSEFCAMRGGTIFANPIGKEAVLNG